MEWLSLYVLPSLGPIVEILMIPISGLAVAALVNLFRKLGYDIEQKNRDAFQTAITNAARLAVSKMGGPGATDYISQSVLDEAVRSLKEDNKDTVEYFKVDDKSIETRVKSQAEIIAQSVPTTISNVAERVFDNVIVPVATNTLINVVRKQF